MTGRGLEGDRYFEGRGTFSGSPDTELTLNESVAGGGLRPLRNPSELDEYEFPMPESGEPSL